MIRRGMCCLCLSLILGILFGNKWQWQFLCLFLLFLVVMAAVLARWKKDVRHVICIRTILCACIFCAAAAHMQAQQSVRNRLSAVLLDGDTITVQGKVQRREERESQGKVLYRGESAAQAGNLQAVSETQQFIYYLTATQVSKGGSVYPSFGILIYSSDGQYQPGNILKVTGRYVPFQISRNEGNFNEKRYRQSRKWEFKVYADTITRISAHENKYAIVLADLRRNMREVFASVMKREDAGVMANITLGEKSLMDEGIKALYQDAGIAHILAISGLHVSILGMGMFSFLRKIGVPMKWGALSAAGLVFSFGMFSGMEVSTMRAVCMFALLMAAQVLGLSYDSLSALSFSAAVQLWENPFLLEYAGFLFSYGAVFGAAVVWKLIREAGEERKMEKGFWKKSVVNMGNTIGLSVCIQLVTLPLSMYFYCEISVYSVFVNACILPFMGVLLSLGLLGGMLGMADPMLGAVVLKPAEGILVYYESICSGAGKLPNAKFITGRPSVEWMIVYAAVIGICLYLVWHRGKKRYLAGAVVALLCLLLFPAKHGFEIDVLDVGQGDGIFIQNDNGEHFFVDGGSSDVANIGEYRILPFLKSRGIRAVKGWIVSHADADHISGLVELLQQGYPVESLIFAEDMVRDDAMESLLAQAERAGCEILYVSAGMEFGSGDVVFTVLGPGEGSGEDRNASSLSLLLEYQGFQGIFTGDIGAEQERELLEEGMLLPYGKVDFYKAAHHGSDHSNSEAFLETVSPRITVVSCAEKNSYGHPGKEAVKRIKAAGSRMFLTMKQGQIRVRPEEGGVRVFTYLP